MNKIMRKALQLSLILTSILCFAWRADAAGPFEDGKLENRTLRLDYIFSGTSEESSIALKSLSFTEGWHGRRVNMKSVPVRGNGIITMTDATGSDTLYIQSFSTLFQEWQTTEEATRVRRSFENVFLLPMPSAEVRVRVVLFNMRGDVSAVLEHNVSPDDILIRPCTGKALPEYRYLRKSGDPGEKIDVAIVAEGYTAEEKGLFYEKAQAAMESILAHEPFRHLAENFNFVAVALESRESGVSVPAEGIWKETALKSNFSTFYMDRYLTTGHLEDLHDALSGIPYEHIVILANTEVYGGGGIYNSYTLTTASNPKMEPVVAHEFGHSFGALADEYYYDDMYSPYYFPDREPWEQNITTGCDFSSKWEDMMTPDGKIGLQEGGGYMSKGVWRACEDCRMKTNTAEGFCPVCQRAIERMVLFNTVELSLPD